MQGVLATVSKAIRRRMAYRRTVAELQRLPIDTALDLDIHHGDAARIARRAIYKQ